MARPKVGGLLFSFLSYNLPCPRLASRLMATGSSALVSGPKQQTFDCLVLSGGGAKGAYGAGVAKALQEYRKLKRIDNSVCYIGTSAGALNAAVLACANADALVALWRGITSKKVLGMRVPGKVRLRLRILRRTLVGPAHFAVFDNSALRSLIATSVKIEDLERNGAHLVVAATNYTTRELAVFFYSPMIDIFKARDVTLARESQRLRHWRKIQSNDDLTNVLLASAAIPFAFPPVEIGTDLYVDGGVGNVTPTREAAYFLRNLEELRQGIAGDVTCVTQNPSRNRLDEAKPLGPLATVLRTIDVFDHVHMRPIVRAWDRINKEVQERKRQIEDMKNWLRTQNLDQSFLAIVEAEIDTRLGRLGGGTKRRDLKLISVEPATAIGETLDFQTKVIAENIERGYRETLQALEKAGRLSASDREDLEQLPV